MLRKLDWFWILFALALTWGVDRWTKLEALKLVGIKDYGFLIFTLQYNPGAILGLFSQLPSVLRVVTLSTGGAFLIFTFFILQYLIPARAMTLRIGMALLLGGIMGNVADRIAWGHVVDFISFRYGSNLTPIFNIADAIQWVGHAMIMVSLIRHAEYFWPESNIRKTQWINLRFQLKYCFILMIVGLGMGIIAGTFSYTYLRVTLLTLTGENHALAQRYLVPFILSLGAVNGIFLGGLYLIGKLLSLRVAGPVYAFERYVEDLLAGNFRSFQVRSSDEFQQLTQLGIKLREHLANIQGGTGPAHSMAKNSSSIEKAGDFSDSTAPAVHQNDSPPLIAAPPPTLPIDAKEHKKNEPMAAQTLVFTPTKPPPPKASPSRVTTLAKAPPLPQPPPLPSSVAQTSESRKDATISTVPRESRPISVIKTVTKKEEPTVAERPMEPSIIDQSPTSQAQVPISVERKSVDSSSITFADSVAPAPLLAEAPAPSIPTEEGPKRRRQESTTEREISSDDASFEASLANLQPHFEDDPPSSADSPALQSTAEETPPTKPIQEISAEPVTNEVMNVMAPSKAPPAPLSPPPPLTPPPPPTPPVLGDFASLEAEIFGTLSHAQQADEAAPKKSNESA